MAAITITTNKKLIMVFAFSLFLAVTVPASAQSDPASVHVVINEVDTNPPGDDFESISEWVELYNPTDSRVDLGGWEIGSSVLARKTLVIPDGTVIGAGQFKTFSYEKIWFLDAGELVQLRDGGGMIIDQTPSITDSDDDRSSWQRIYDGYDTDSPADWKFAASSPGNSNGKLIVSQDAGEVSVTLETDKTEFLFGEYVIISGSVSEKVFVGKPTFAAESIEVLVEGPNYRKGITLYPDLNLNYETSLGLQKVFGVAEGIYDVSVEYAGATAKTKFSIGDELIPVEAEPEDDLSISFDKDSYIPGQTALISAKTTDIVPYQGLQFRVDDPEGTQVFDGSLYPNTQGEFKTSIFMTTVNPVFGNYTITADYADKHARSSFELLAEVIDDKPISLSTDKKVYGLGETVEISGRLNNLWIFSMDLEIQQVGSGSLDSEPTKLFKEVGAVRLKGDSTFAYEFEIGNNPGKFGEYRVRVHENVGEAEIFFKVVQNPQTYESGDGSPLTVYTDKETYDKGSKFSIFGKVSNIQTSSAFYTSPVDIKIIKPDGDEISSVASKHASFSKTGKAIGLSLTAIPDIGGNYKLEDTLHASVYDVGTYVVEASYADGAYRASSTFTIVDPLDIEEKFRLDLNKEVFGLGEDVIVEGIFPSLSQGSGITITLYKPDGDSDEFGVLANDSRFSWKWTTPIAERTHVLLNDRGVLATNYGVYQLTFSTPAGSSNLFFKVSPSPETDTLDVSPLKVTTDKPVYNAGENVVVSGVAQKRSQGQEGLVVEERAKIIIKQTVLPFKELYDAFLYLDNGGNFETKFNLPVTVFEEGKYRVIATYENNRAETLFTVDNEFRYGGDDDLSLILGTDKDEYHPGDSVEITGRLNKLVYLENVEITVVHEDQTQITCGSFICGSSGTKVTVFPSDSGAFNYQYPIPSDDSSKGMYEVLADTDFGVFSLQFSVTDAPESEPEPAPVSRVTEKFNRIADAQIPISSGEVTTQDELRLLPRTIQGSLFTPARGEEASVNIKVVSEGGTCVIGPADGCLVSELTRAPGEIYKIVEIDGKSYNVRYSGPDVRLEKFTILPSSSEDTIHIENWNVEILKDDQPSRFYYKVTRVSQE